MEQRYRKGVPHTSKKSCFLRLFLLLDDKTAVFGNLRFGYQKVNNPTVAIVLVFQITTLLIGLIGETEERVFLDIDGW